MGLVVRRDNAEDVDGTNPYSLVHETEAVLTPEVMTSTARYRLQTYDERKY